VAENIKGVVKRAETMACKLEREQAIQNSQNPTNKVIVHTVKSLVDTATSPINLMKMTEIYNPWF
jgi:transformation/transcription domain-associated protein